MATTDIWRQRRPRRVHIAHAARDYLHTQSNRTVSISELCAVVGVAERTLHLAFHETYGMPPKHYMKLQRLAGAHHALLQAGATTTVSQIAMDWGFLHLGRFAVEYRAQFGETPSASLLRRRRVA
jgi:AraC-like DNA-binding protein